MQGFNDQTQERAQDRHLLGDGVSDGVDVLPDDLLRHRLRIGAHRLARRQDHLRRQPLRQGLDLQGRNEVR